MSADHPYHLERTLPSPPSRTLSDFTSVLSWNLLESTRNLLFHFCADHKILTTNNKIITAQKVLSRTYLTVLSFIYGNLRESTDWKLLKVWIGLPVFLSKVQRVSWGRSAELHFDKTKRSKRVRKEASLLKKVWLVIINTICLANFCIFELISFSLVPNSSDQGTEVQL